MAPSYMTGQESSGHSILQENNVSSDLLFFETGSKCHVKEEHIIGTVHSFSKTGGALILAFR